MDDLTRTSAKMRTRLDQFLKSSESFRKVARDAAYYIHEKILESEQRRDVADKLHGTPLGHPLHPVLTDVTIGGWMLGFVFDILAFITRSRRLRAAGDALTFIGTASAVPTALTGMTDFSTIKQDAASYGAAHGMLNGIAFFFFLRSTMARMSGKRGSALFFSLIGVTVASMSAWLGGDLVYRHRVGVNHATQDGPQTWTAVMPLDRLKANTLTRGTANDVPILLYRTEDDEIHAIGAVCSHAGGPLDDGQIVQDMCVECPWHQSVFDLKTGRVVHGPSTFNQPHYEVRIRDGQIDVRAAPAPMKASSDDGKNETLYDAPASQPTVMRDQAYKEASKRLKDEGTDEG